MHAGFLFFFLFGARRICNINMGEQEEHIRKHARIRICTGTTHTQSFFFAVCADSEGILLSHAFATTQPSARTHTRVSRA